MGAGLWPGWLSRRNVALLQEKVTKEGAASRDCGGATGENEAKAGGDSEEEEEEELQSEPSSADESVFAKAGN